MDSSNAVRAATKVTIPIGTSNSCEEYLGCLPHPRPRKSASNPIASPIRTDTLIRDHLSGSHGFIMVSTCCCCCCIWWKTRKYCGTWKRALSLSLCRRRDAAHIHIVNYAKTLSFPPSSLPLPACLPARHCASESHKVVLI